MSMIATLAPILRCHPGGLENVRLPLGRRAHEKDLCRERLAESPPLAGRTAPLTCFDQG